MTQLFNVYDFGCIVIKANLSQLKSWAVVVSILFCAFSAVAYQLLAAKLSCNVRLSYEASYTGLWVAGLKKQMKLNRLPGFYFSLNVNKVDFSSWLICFSEIPESVVAKCTFLTFLISTFET